MHELAQVKNTALNIANLINDAAAYLVQHNVESPRRNAEELLAYVLGVPLYGLHIFEGDIAPEQALHFWELVSARAQGEPLQYILGETEFYGLRFKVAQGVFIPRPETEILVDAVLGKIHEIRFTRYASRDTLHEIRLLDLCAGCGNIAISALLELTKSGYDCKMYATDISEAALRCASANAKFHGVEDKVEFSLGDLFKPVNGLRFDVILSNPPYIPTDDISGLSFEVKREPLAALDGGGDGMSFYRRIIDEAPKYLNKEGFIALEIGDDQAEAIKWLIEQSGQFCGTEVIKDYNGKDRVIIALCNINKYSIIKSNIKN